MGPPAVLLETSAVIPTRGLGGWIPLTVASVLATRGVSEVILAHDRRPGEPELPALLRADPRVRVVETPGPGLPTARNTGLAAARHPLVSFIDDDDLWLPEHLEVTAEALARHPEATLIAHDQYLFDDPSPGADAVPPGDLSGLPRRFAAGGAGPLSLADLVRLNRISPSAVTLVRERLRPGDRFRPELTSIEDYDLWLRLSEHHLLIWDPRPAAIVRRRQGSMSRNLRRMAEITLEVLGPHLARARAAGQIEESEARARLGQLYHELAYACLLADDLPAARAALRQSIPRQPGRLKNWAYAAMTLAPAAVRARAFARGRRDAVTG